MPGRKKIALIGAGNIGGELASLAARAELGDVVLFDIPEKEGVAKGKALDLEQNDAVLGHDAKITGSSNWADCAGADVVIITAGVPRKPGMSRDDLLSVNLKIIRNVAENLKQHCPNAFVIVVSNPLDVMVYELKRVTGFSAKKVVGMAGILDSGRFQLFLAQEAGVSVKDVRAMVLGGHGDTMVPLISYTTVSGIPITQLLAKDKLDAIVDRARNGGAEIVKYLKTGSAYYAPSSGAVQMVEAIAHHQKRILPCSAWLQGEYGMKDLFLGVPVKLGAKGMEKIIEVTLTGDEKAALAKSAEAVREPMAVIKF